MVFHPLFLEALSHQFLKFLNNPACLGTYRNFDTLADECSTYSYSEGIKRIQESFYNQKNNNTFNLSKNLMVLSCFGITLTNRPINILDWGAEWLLCTIYAITFLEIKQLEDI